MITKSTADLFIYYLINKIIVCDNELRMGEAVTVRGRVMVSMWIVKWKRLSGFERVLIRKISA